MNPRARKAARKRTGQSITLRRTTARKTHRHAPESRKQEGSKGRRNDGRMSFEWGGNTFKMDGLG